MIGVTHFILAGHVFLPTLEIKMMETIQDTVRLIAKVSLEIGNLNLTLIIMVFF